MKFYAVWMDFFSKFFESVKKLYVEKKTNFKNSGNNVFVVPVFQKNFIESIKP